MCSIILRIHESGVDIAANRDELIRRPWVAPGSYWPEYPGVVAGRDETAGGTWMGVNKHGVMAAVLNRHGALGPAPGKRSRGELPLLALAAATARDAAEAVAKLDAGAYRRFNLVVADAQGGFWLRGMEAGAPEVFALAPGVAMLTAGEVNDVAEPRIARHLPKFRAAGWADWGALLADDAPPVVSALNIAPQNGFGTVCASLIALRKDALPVWMFAAGRPGAAAFLPVAGIGS